MLYAVVALDGTDAEAPARRAAVRQKHLEGASALHASGGMFTGGALLGPEGQMVGSLMVVEAESEQAARELIENDIYTREGVWQSYQIWPYKKAFWPTELRRPQQGRRTKHVVNNSA